MQPTALPENIQTICKAFVYGLTTILGDKLYGIYMYGATVFEDSGRAQDIDCHVILHVVPTDNDRERLFALHADLERRFPPLGGEIDAYYVLLKDAKDTAPPANHLANKKNKAYFPLRVTMPPAPAYPCAYGRPAEWWLKSDTSSIVDPSRPSRHRLTASGNCYLALIPPLPPLFGSGDEITEGTGKSYVAGWLSGDIVLKG